MWWPTSEGAEAVASARPLGSEGLSIGLWIVHWYEEKRTGLEVELIAGVDLRGCQGA
jgi:hypothetical protein